MPRRTSMSRSSAAGKRQSAGSGIGKKERDRASRAHKRPASVCQKSLSLRASPRRAGDGGTHGSRPTGCGNHPGRAESSAPTKQNKNRAKRDVEDAVPYDGGHEPCKTGRRGGVPYTLCHCEERSDAAIRSSQPKETDFHTSDIGHWRGMTALRAVNGGTHGPRPTGCGGHTGRTGSSAPTRQNRNRAKRDGGDGVPYE